MALSVTEICADLLHFLTKPKEIEFIILYNIAC